MFAGVKDNRQSWGCRGGRGGLVPQLDFLRDQLMGDGVKHGTW